MIHRPASTMIWHFAGFFGCGLKEHIQFNFPKNICKVSVSPLTASQNGREAQHARAMDKNLVDLFSEMTLVHVFTLNPVARQVNVTVFALTDNITSNSFPTTCQLAPKTNSIDFDSPGAAAMRDEITPFSRCLLSHIYVLHIARMCETDATAACYEINHAFSNSSKFFNLPLRRRSSFARVL